MAITLKNANELFFARDGAQIYASALTPSEMAGIDEAIADLPSNKAGVRIHELAVLHASGASTEPRSRRVLQVDYSAALLPGGLGWSGV